jgi:hypothetical protein
LQQGQVTYGYYGQTFNHFDTYAAFDINDIPLKQFIGEKIVTDEAGTTKALGIKE